MPINKYPHTFTLILLSIFTISSCITVNKELGDQFVPDDQIFKVYSDEFPIEIQSALPDSIQSASSTHLIFGAMNSGTFGMTTVSTVANLTPAMDSVSFGEHPELVKATLNLTVDSTRYFYPEDEGLAQNLYLYKLNRQIDTVRLFNASYTAEDFDPTPISVGSPVYNGEDKIKIEISESFAKELLATTDEEFIDYEKFTERIKGLCLATGDINSSREGGRINYLSTASSYISVKYKHTEAEKEISRKDSTFNFYFGASFAVNLTSTGSQSLASEHATDHLYIDGYNGVKPYIKGTYLQKLMEDWAKSKGLEANNIILSKASVIFPYETPNSSRELNLFHGAIFGFTRTNHADSVKTFYPLPDVYKLTNTGSMNPSHEYYSCNITCHLQDLLINKDPEGISNGSADLWFMPLLNYADSRGNQIVTLDNVTYRNTILNGCNAKRRPTLKFSYVVMRH